jgi:zinc transporter ZupT
MALEANAATVAAGALLTALATGLGAAPFLATRSMSPRWVGLANAVAAGVMLAASVTLVVEGGDYSGPRVALGVLGGIAFVVIAGRLLGEHEHLHFGVLRGADARKAIALVLVMTVHSVTEGVGVGVAYGGGEELGVFITLAIAVHNIPEGLAISLVLVPRGTSVGTAAWWSVFSSLPQPLVAVPAFLFVEAFFGVLPFGLGFAAGAMVWISVAELLPDALATASRRSVAVTLTLSMVAMTAFQQFVL